MRKLPLAVLLVVAVACGPAVNYEKGASFSEIETGERAFIVALGDCDELREAYSRRSRYALTDQAGSSKSCAVLNHGREHDAEDYDVRLYEQADISEDYLER